MIDQRQKSLVGRELIDSRIAVMSADVCAARSPSAAFEVAITDSVVAILTTGRDGDGLVRWDIDLQRQMVKLREPVIGVETSLDLEFTVELRKKAPLTG